MTTALEFGTKVQIKTGDRHELPIAYLRDSTPTGNGEYRYRAVFPYKCTVRFANVYASEILSVEGVYADSLLSLLALAR